MIYAIDYGTSNSLLAAATAEGALAPLELDPEAPDPTILRSILFFPSMKECFYGQRAIREFSAHDMEGRLIRSIKKYLPVRSFVGTFVEDRPLNLEDIIANFLREMRRRANERTGRDVKAAVIGRPARFAEDDADDSFAQYRLERAARQAGFDSIEFFPEPVAAAFGFRSMLTEPRVVLVADLGGGTSDFTVVRLGPGQHKASDVLSIGGVSVAGDALDGAIMRHRVSRHFGVGVEYKVPFGSNVLSMPVWLMEKLCSPPEISLLRKRDTMEFFRNVRQWSLGEEDREKMDALFTLLENQLGFPVFEEIERLKRALSESAAGEFRFDYADELAIREKVRRKEFEEFASDQIGRILSALDETVRSAGIRFEDVDIVCCTGGTAKVPAIAEALKKRFGQARLSQYNHHHSVVTGLAERARQLAAQ